jgi:hypothetical protein
MTLLSVVAFAAMSAQTGSLDRYIYPMAKPISAPPVVVDVSDFPESKAWGEAAKLLVEQWFPTVSSLLATEDFKPPKQLNIVIKKEISAPAWATGDTITISGKWITEHPDDLGMVVHELTHVIQQYPNSRNKPGWLVEGIADYIRWWRYEPEAPRPRINVEKANYSDSYRTTGYWLAWVSRKYDKRIVPALDRAMRKREDPMPLFEKMTGKDAAALWKEFIESKP